MGGCDAQRKRRQARGDGSRVGCGVSGNDNQEVFTITAIPGSFGDGDSTIGKRCAANQRSQAEDCGGGGWSVGQQYHLFAAEIGGTGERSFDGVGSGVA